jgi:hypothetical protein
MRMPEEEKKRLAAEEICEELHQFDVQTVPFAETQLLREVATI